MPLVSGFTLRFFEFSIAVAVADRSRVGPETNVHLFFGLRLERLELDVNFSGHCARRKKRLEAEEARQTATKRVATNDFSSSGSLK
ncbi:unnamed protein product [Heterotrigona itama]|uniref:Uncharacterized protein n=1 Tax=Heterotrigona itama TaxID=395501 RepID=A0A6V7GSX2_9HYME|nr:unnamed protein product [Heterotrigona itama]